MTELRSLIPAFGADVEVRARCRDDGHPVGAIHPDWNGGPASFCHCGRVIRPGVLAVVAWPRPEPVRRCRPVFQ